MYLGKSYSSYMYVQEEYHVLNSGYAGLFKFSYNKGPLTDSFFYYGPIILGSVHLHQSFLCCTFPMEPFIVIPPFSSQTMTDIVNDSSPFLSTSPPENNKKQCTDEPDHVFAQHKFKTLIQIIFKKVPRASTKFNVLMHIKQVILTMTKANLTLSLLSLDKKPTYHPSHNDFPASEDSSKAYFSVHLVPIKPTAYQNVMFGCVLRSSKTVSSIKFKKINPSPVINWLKPSQVFIEANALGHDVTRMVGHLLQAHPKITH